MDIILVIGVLLSGYVLYVLLSNKVKTMEDKIVKLESNNTLYREAIIKMNSHINELTNSHNQIADILNETKSNKQEADFIWDEYSPFNTPKGEA
jgi:signal transduction histidine kinase